MWSVQELEGFEAGTNIQPASTPFVECDLSLTQACGVAATPVSLPNRNVERSNVMALSVEPDALAFMRCFRRRQAVDLTLHENIVMDVDLCIRVQMNILADSVCHFDQDDLPLAFTHPIL
ncbi:hypothetical protein FOMPIDRAFT_1051921 [Fomitopsis schrenkii]|uniref:Uncharacterized protein n=1 Tax=Fomitopsis schrenkii TaxID=2126942 RepID=S8F8M8_FOMSC|nr:hypothetical protein FOMPIDRAFT_1051921 [Fomitopsis schrenkii]